MITATQEKSVPSPGKQAMIYFDGVILAHCNEAEWNKFKSEHTNEAILDRIVRVNVPYCLEYSEEQKIYKKLLDETQNLDFVQINYTETVYPKGLYTYLSGTRKRLNFKNDFCTLIFNLYAAE